MDIPVDLDIVFLSSPFRSDKKKTRTRGEEMAKGKTRKRWKVENEESDGNATRREGDIYIYIEEGVVALVDFPFSYSI